MPARRPGLRVVILGGSGFVGLNIAEALLRRGHDVLCIDRAPLPAAASLAFRALPGRLETAIADVTEPALLRAMLPPGADALVAGAAITPGPAREARDPESLLAVNLGAMPGILRAARAAGLRRVIHLSSAAAYGAAPERAVLSETDPARPQRIYGITKLASEWAGERLAELWDLDFLSLRLSTVFGPWEYATGLRDTMSPPYQILRAAARGEAALLPRVGLRDWLYAPDAARAVCHLLEAGTARHSLYNLTFPGRWSLLEWGEAVARLRGQGFACRLAAPGEAPNIDLYAVSDRAPLDPARLREEFGWQARHGLRESARHLEAWWRRHGGAMLDAA
ncbi:NAD-dependent epimerase/dehydratase family protein [Pseudoroseomonas sp. WGS1072]|uniref:NAD-dependent epimerase/dehydratase family protein n=1 Tax=Roseomonas sp. WGS1072 TaxID=3366816 RepID=UPI003BF18777